MIYPPLIAGFFETILAFLVVPGIHAALVVTLGFAQGVTEAVDATATRGRNRHKANLHGCRGLGRHGPANDAIAAARPGVGTYKTK